MSVQSLHEPEISRSRTKGVQAAGVSAVSEVEFMRWPTQIVRIPRCRLIAEIAMIFGRSFLEHWIWVRTGLGRSPSWPHGVKGMSEQAARDRRQG